VHIVPPLHVGDTVMCFASRTVLRDRSLSKQAKALYSMLCTYADAKGVCWPSGAALADDLGASERSVRRGLTELVAFGAVERKRKANAPSLLQLKDPKATDTMESVGVEATDTQDVRSLPPATPRQRPTAVVCIGTDQKKDSESSPSLESKRQRQSPGIPPQPPKGGGKDRRTIGMVCQQAAEIWNQVCGTLGRPTIRLPLREERKRRLLKRLKEDCHGDIREWRVMCDTVIASNFLMAQEGNWQGATFDWVICPRNFTKIVEGNYTNQKPKGVISVAAEWAAEMNQRMNGTHADDDDEMLAGARSQVPVQAGHRY
jgi:Helix-turn-helix domain